MWARCRCSPPPGGRRLRSVLLLSLAKLGRRQAQNLAGVCVYLGHAPQCEHENPFYSKRVYVRDTPDA